MDFKSLCRLCLQSGDVMSPLNEPIIVEKENFRVLEFLDDVAKINVAIEEGMPDQLCFVCLTEIRRIYAFIKKCKKSDGMLARFKEIRRELKMFAEDSNSPLDIAKIKKEVTDEHPVPDGNRKHTNGSRLKNSEEIIVTLDLCAERVEPIEAAIIGEAPTFEISSVATLSPSQLVTDTGSKTKMSVITEIKEIIDQSSVLDSTLNGRSKSIENVIVTPDLCVETKEPADSVIIDETPVFKNTSMSSLSPSQLVRSIRLKGKRSDVNYITENKKEMIAQHPLPNETLNGSHTAQSSKSTEKIVVTADHCVEAEEQADNTFIDKTSVLKNTPVESLSSSQLIRSMKLERKRSDIYDITEIKEDAFDLHPAAESTLNGNRPDGSPSEGLKRKRSDLNKCIICSICSMTFNYKKSLKRHMERKHSTIDHSVECDICNKTYRSKEGLRTHKVTVHAEELIARSISTAVQCPICFKFFENTQCFKIHLQSHKEFVCEYCCKAFRRPSDLATHQESSQRGEFRCEICLKVLERASCLHAHIQDHEKKEKTLDCKLCGNNCPNKLAFQIHMQVNHGVDPNRCKICLEMFRTKIKLMKHVLSTHSDNTYYQNCYDNLKNKKELDLM